ncbi:MAG: AAA family ATPase [Clostridiaceae bacterium]|nr:AAA family ATPase [Clostridiaceae bacterium]
MAKYKVLAVADGEDIRLELRRRLARENDLALVGIAGMDADVLSKIKGYAPHVVLLVQEDEIAGIMEIAQRIYQSFPGCAIVLLTPKQDLDIQLVKNAMQVGIRQVVDASGLDRLQECLVQAAIFEQGRTAETGRDPRVVAVYGGKGGSGKTTVAVNLAAALAQSGHRTTFIDLCLNFGDAALLLNLTAKDTIADLVQEKISFTIDDIKSFSMQHASGVSMLCAPASPEFAEYVTSKHVEMLINVMRPYYDFIIIDLPGDLSECTLAAMENSDDILLISRTDIGNLRAAKLVLGILTTLQQQDKVQIVINADHKSIITHKDFERVLERPVNYIVPEDVRTARLSQERGSPFVLDMPRTPIAKGIQRIARYWTDSNNGRKGS